jgi:hypothetical protein
MTVRDRHLWGAGAAACAVCCAPPLLALLGIAGAGLAATVATIAFAGLVFGLVVGIAAIAAVVIRRRRDTTIAVTSACEPPTSGPVEVSLTSRPTETT